MAIKTNIETVTSRIEKACHRVGRNPNDITIIAVSKTVDAERIKTAASAGITNVGENWVQEAWTKHQQVGVDLRWHMIGHLQTNKVKRAVQFFDVIQSVDSVRLAEKINKRAESLNKRIEILVEVNTSGEESKFGLWPEDVVSFIKKIADLKYLQIKGLMTIGTFLEDAELVRPCFVTLRELKERLQELSIHNVSMQHLSMGMTNDFETAIEEGSNMIRVGRAIFGERI